MSRKTKIWLIMAVFLMLIGCIIFVGAMTVLNWDFKKLSTVKYETNNYEINEDYKKISIMTDTADILFVPSENAKSTVICHEQKNTKHSVKVSDSTLLIETVDTRKWYEHIGINLGSTKITVYLPKAEYSSLLINESTGNIKIPKDFKFGDVNITLSTGDVYFSAEASKPVKIKTSTGNICAENASIQALELSATTGRITVSNVICNEDIHLEISTGKTNLKNIQCKNLISNGSTGDISLNSVIATEKFTIKRSTGDVNFNCSDATEISVDTDTGDVTGSLLTEKVFITQTDTGNIDVPKTVNGGKCEISTDTGDIKIFKITLKPTGEVKTPPVKYTQ